MSTQDERRLILPRTNVFGDLPTLRDVPPASKTNRSLCLGSETCVQSAVRRVSSLLRRRGRARRYAVDLEQKERLGCITIAF